MPSQRQRQVKKVTEIQKNDVSHRACVRNKLSPQKSLDPRSNEQKIIQRSFHHFGIDGTTNTLRGH